MRTTALRRLVGAGLLLAAAILFAFCHRVPTVEGATRVSTKPRVDPDYTELTLPPNIAPLNFRIQEPGRDFVVKISPDAGEALSIHCPHGVCRIPLNRWRRLLAANKGKRLYYDVFVRQGDGAWRQFERFTNAVAEEPVDSYLVYRLLAPNKGTSRIRGIYQRDLESFRESPIITLRDGEFYCFNCHTFCQHDPNRFILHVRVKHAGMVLVTDGKVRKINTKCDPMFRPLAFASWSPDGNHLAATCNQFFSFFPATSREYDFEAVEKRGDLVVYDVAKNTLSTTEAVFEDKYIETHPCWSPDGKYIYFVRGRDTPLVEPQDLEKFEFDMMRIAFDVATDAWGTPEVVKAYSKLGLSCAFPRPSPDGKYILHIVVDKTTYPIHQKSSDVCLLDLATGEWRRLDAVNSDRAESYPRWSLNGRWLTFLSNRRDAMSALPYFAYFDTHGEAHKAFVLPQKDPAFFDTFLDTYNVTELVKSRVKVSAYELAKGMKQLATNARFAGAPEVDAYTGATAARLPPRG